MSLASNMSILAAAAYGSFDRSLSGCAAFLEHAIVDLRLLFLGRLDTGRIVLVDAIFRCGGYHEPRAHGNHVGIVDDCLVFFVDVYPTHLYHSA